MFEKQKPKPVTKTLSLTFWKKIPDFNHILPLFMLHSGTFFLPFPLCVQNSFLRSSLQFLFPPALLLWTESVVVNVIGTVKSTEFNATQKADGNGGILMVLAANGQMVKVTMDPYNRCVRVFQPS